MTNIHQQNFLKKKKVQTELISLPQNKANNKKPYQTYWRTPKNVKILSSGLAGTEDRVTYHSCQAALKACLSLSGYPALPHTHRHRVHLRLGAVSVASGSGINERIRSWVLSKSAVLVNIDDIIRVYHLQRFGAQKWWFSVQSTFKLGEIRMLHLCPPPSAQTSSKTRPYYSSGIIYRTIIPPIRLKGGLLGGTEGFILLNPCQRHLGRLHARCILAETHNCWSL